MTISGQVPRDRIVPAKPALIDELSPKDALRWLAGAILAALLWPFRHHAQHYRRHEPPQPIIVAALVIAHRRDEMDRIRDTGQFSGELPILAWPTEDRDYDATEAALTAAARRAALHRGRDASDLLGGAL